MAEQEKITVDRDEEHLKLLSTFHYVVAGISAFFACIPLIHLAVGIIMTIASYTEGGDEAPVLLGVGLLFSAIGAFAVLLGWSLAFCIFLSGRYLAARKHYNFCMVIAAISCLCMPFGTILGIFTIITLTRGSVKGMFEGAGK